MPRILFLLSVGWFFLRNWPSASVQLSIIVEQLHLHTMTIKSLANGSKKRRKNSRQFDASASSIRFPHIIIFSRMISLCQRMAHKSRWNQSLLRWLLRGRIHYTGWERYAKKPRRMRCMFNEDFCAMYACIKGLHLSDAYSKRAIIAFEQYL